MLTQSDPRGKVRATSVAALSYSLIVLELMFSLTSVSALQCATLSVWCTNFDRGGVSKHTLHLVEMTTVFFNCHFFFVSSFLSVYLNPSCRIMEGQSDGVGEGEGGGGGGGGGGVEKE